MSKITPEVRAFADEIKKHIKIEDGKPVVSADAYAQTLPEGMSLEQIKLVNEHNAKFYPAATLASGEVAHGHMVKHKDVERLDFEFPMVDRDNWSVSHMRTRESVNPRQPDEKITTYGAYSAKLNTYATKASRGQMSAVGDELSSKLFEALGGK